MNTQIINTSKTVAAIIVSVALLGGIAEAEIVSHSKNIVIELPTDLPELAQHRGIALQLYSGNEDGKTYLYIEQHEGQRLVVFDVTDPLHMKMVNAVTVSAPVPFDFVGSVGGTALLVRFRDDKGMAVLDLKHAKAPVLRVVNDLRFSGRTEPLGQMAFLAVNEKLMEGQPGPRDYQAVDTSQPTNPVVLDKVKLVNYRTTREETGTTFMLGSEGLTIIRRPRVEQEYQIAQNAQ